MPLSILLASSIVQDGHGMLPMLAHPRREFVLVKAINFCAGLGFGYVAQGFYGFSGCWSETGALVADESTRPGVLTVADRVTDGTGWWQ